jgi:hypothetical protein
MLPHVLIVVQRFFAQKLAYPPELLRLRKIVELGLLAGPKNAESHEAHQVNEQIDDK